MPALIQSPNQPLRLTPTDLAQYIRLGQCRRYLRLQLHRRRFGERFLRDYDVAPQRLSPLLTRSGASFEAQITQAIAAAYPILDLSSHIDENDNQTVLSAVQALPPDQVRVLLQPRLAVEVDGWRVTGDIDILRLARDADGALRVLIADMKSSPAVRMEHRLQVAFYRVMLRRLLESAGLPPVDAELGILYRGAAPAEPDDAVLAAQREAARHMFGTGAGLLEIIPDPDSLVQAVYDQTLAPDSVAVQVARAPFEDVPYHLDFKCDGCMFNEFCMKSSVEADDLSLLPYLASQEKTALRRSAISTIRDLAHLKELSPDGAAPNTLVSAPGREELVRQLATTWPLGGRLDELVHRARSYRRSRKEAIHTLPYIPDQGYTSLPYADEQQNPNLVRVYLDAQHDFLNNRAYLLSALVAACEGGRPLAQRRRAVVHLADQAPTSDDIERALLVRWVRDIVAAIVQLATPDAEGKRRAPIHLIFYDKFAQQVLLDALGRHMPAVMGATPLYDFITQLAAFDSPIASFLAEEIRRHKNYPMVCQTLQSVAAYLRFDWNAPLPYRDHFRVGLFDWWGKLDEPPPGETAWYVKHARFNNQLPLEYAYAAWGDLPDPPTDREDDLAAFRPTTRDLLTGFAARRLDAMEFIAADLGGNKLTEKRPFDLDGLDQFEDKARSLADALTEFVLIERHVDLGQWKNARHLAPERRVLLGETLLARYHDADQPPDVVALNRVAADRAQARERMEAASPDGQLTKEQKKATEWSLDNLRVRLRVDLSGVDCDLDQALALSTLREGDIVVVYPRWTVDSRLPPEQRTLNTPTPRQMLWGQRARLDRLRVERAPSGRALAAWVEVVLRNFHANQMKGFAFSGFHGRPFEDGALYTLDPSPDDWSGYYNLKVTEGLRDLQAGRLAGRNALYERLNNPAAGAVDWPAEAAQGQARFLAGLDTLRERGALHDFEPSKRELIGAMGDAPILLVQGPPGTGKSYSTAFALLARLQGALAAGRPYRVLLSCKTHAAVDVLLKNIVEVRDKLAALRAAHPDVFTAHIDPRLFRAPIYRIDAGDTTPPGVLALPKDNDKAATKRTADLLAELPYAILGATPGALYQLAHKKNSKTLFGATVAEALVLDEASQMSLPEALLAALPLKPDGQIIVVGDHRQMPPIVKHDWDGEPRRTFQEYRAYESLFQTLLTRRPTRIAFEESFRLHADMAEFLRREVYAQDGIRYFSRRRALLDPAHLDDDFLAAVLGPHPLVVVVHDEAASQTRNPFEQALVAPILATLADPAGYGLGPESGLGVVVPHRAQRAALQRDLPMLSRRDPATGVVTLSSVDTVERFQGGERHVIVVSVTESDPDYLLQSAGFLLDPRRLTVALSRAKRKMILVAARSVFNLFSADEDTYQHALLWKNLLRRTCAERLWCGKREGQAVEVWGNPIGSDE